MGFGDFPPCVPEDGAEDALGFFQRVAAEREEVCDRLTKIHDRISRDRQPSTRYRDSRRVIKFRCELGPMTGGSISSSKYGRVHMRCVAGWGVIDMRSSRTRVGSPVDSKSSSQTASSRMYMMCRDALFPVGITLRDQYPPQMTRISFNRWWITILWDEEGGASLFSWLPGRGVLIELTKMPPCLSARRMKKLRSIYIPMGCASGLIREQSEHV